MTFNYPVAIKQGFTAAFRAYAGRIRHVEVYQPAAVERAVRTLLAEGLPRAAPGGQR